MVVSPPIALMVYQVQSLRHDGVKAFIISSGTRVVIPKLFRATEGALQTANLVFYSPKASHSSKWREVLKNAAVSAVVIDESICPHITTCMFGSSREVGCVTTFIAALTEALKAVRSTQALSSFYIYPCTQMRAGNILIQP